MCNGGSKLYIAKTPAIASDVVSRIRFFECVQLVEGRVRRSLQAVRAGKATPQQALQSAVQQLAAELSEDQFSTIVDYFSAKHTQGQLSGAKQLLLQALCTVKQQQQQPRRQALQDQQQAKLCPDPGSLLSSKTSAPGTVSPAFQQPQQQHHHQQHHQQAFPGLTAARDTQDVRRYRDQSTPLGPFQHLQQLTSAQQQQQQPQQQGTQQNPSTNRQQQDAPASAVADGGKCQAFKQGLSPLQV